MIDWQSDETHLLLNPRMPADERARLERLAAQFMLPAHVLLATSGTTGALKLTALSKQALLASAAAVNRHLESTRDDVWLCVLPAFHVGGLGIYARAHLSGARVVTEWAPDVTLVSLVPAQVSDFVREPRVAPQPLRAVVVGGGALDPAVFDDAIALGWPLHVSYGMTECCSQIATARCCDPELILLDHFEARVEDDGRLAFRGASTLTAYITDDGVIDPKVDGWFVSEDLGSIEGRVLRVRGRVGEFVKIGGESVDLQRLDRILFEIAGARAAVVAVPDARLGHVIHLVVEGDGEFAAAFNERVLPFERARAVHRVPSIPRTPLGKLMRAKLLAAIE
ncbi:MAG TPA: AMP-binding protein [Thermoanaerobaculia bacterium]|nr:AMP-binding protein [Thermoanaerobaculia bacterium]